MFWRIRRRRARMHLPCHHVFAIPDLAQKVVTICLCDQVQLISLSSKNVGFVLI